MSHPFDTLTPDLVLDAVESIGYLSDARVLALNSYENRVYQVGVEDETPLIAKFYRPGRWSDAAILEEHQFSLELAEHEVLVVAPLERDGSTLYYTAEISLAQALTNTIVQVPTFDNRLLSVAVNQVVSPGFVKKVPGEGMPVPGAPGEKGDLVIKFCTKFPETLTPEVKATLKKLL